MVVQALERQLDRQRGAALLANGLDRHKNGIMRLAAPGPRFPVGNRIAVNGPADVGVLLVIVVGRNNLVVADCRLPLDGLFLVLAACRLDQNGEIAEGTIAVLIGPARTSM